MQIPLLLQYYGLRVQEAKIEKFRNCPVGRARKGFIPAFYRLRGLSLFVCLFKFSSRNIEGILC